MNIYHIEQDKVTDYDTYSDAVVIAESSDAARVMHPDGGSLTHYDNGTERFAEGAWVTDAQFVTVTLLGASIETKSRVVCSSFHAG